MRLIVFGRPIEKNVSKGLASEMSKLSRVDRFINGGGHANLASGGTAKKFKESLAKLSKQYDIREIANQTVGQLIIAANDLDEWLSDREKQELIYIFKGAVDIPGSDERRTEVKELLNTVWKPEVRQYIEYDCNVIMVSAHGTKAKAAKAIGKVQDTVTEELAVA